MATTTTVKLTDGNGAGDYGTVVLSDPGGAWFYNDPRRTWQYQPGAVNALPHNSGVWMGSFGNVTLKSDQFGDDLRLDSYDGSASAGGGKICGGNWMGTPIRWSK